MQLGQFSAQVGMQRDKRIVGMQREGICQQERWGMQANWGTFVIYVKKSDISLCLLLTKVLLLDILVLREWDTPNKGAQNDPHSNESFPQHHGKNNIVGERVSPSGIS